MFNHDKWDMRILKLIYGVTVRFRVYEVHGRF